MFIVGIIVGLIGAAIGMVAGLVGGLFGLLGGLAGAAAPLIPIAMIVLGVIWLVNPSHSRNAAPARAAGGAVVPPPGGTNTRIGNLRDQPGRPKLLEESCGTLARLLSPWEPSSWLC